MFSSIRSRLIVIALLIVGSIYFLFPRTVTLRVQGPNGVMHDDTVTRVPLKRGLDLQGGMHLALELDQSKQVSADPKKDPDATRFESISYKDVMAKELGVMDQTAITLCKENKVPIIVLNIHRHGEVARALSGERVGTIVQ